jgi:hypothetical protein
LNKLAALLSAKQSSRAGSTPNRLAIIDSGRSDTLVAECQHRLVVLRRDILSVVPA